MTYTVATLPVPSASFDWIKKKLEAAGYTHAIGREMLDLTHIGLTKLDSFEFAGNEDASLMDVALYISEIAFKAGYVAGMNYGCDYGDMAGDGHKAWSEWEPSEQMKDHLVEGFEALRDELAANIEARTAEAQGIIQRASELLKVEALPPNTLIERCEEINREIIRRGLVFDLDTARDIYALLSGEIHD
ncbi:hypothetical protein LAV_00159 [Sphingobium phage Lacusarx]|uniref:Uncharacterized protein n=1 Tax=Sphingobium phage Lacusarx TaxID=1980139 RepID=A0A1W6DX96_9CAUD|nr:hypothetical protein FDH44_gp144 [Sphingobium phage Lacusarx]ARK07534.1 hypothetical protein LAV_00159 [Sphingobium phage Lacusarx]